MCLSKKNIAAWLFGTALLLQVFIFISCTSTKATGNTSSVKIVPVDSGWAANSINTPVFRKNSLVSYGDTQFIAYYNAAGYMMLGKRKLNEGEWQLKQTPYKGNVADAHNIISIMVDGDGYLHAAWDHHNNRLHYARSVQPGSLDLSEQMAMTGIAEGRISYPEFYRLANGNLLFFYRDGGSGQGNLVINQYNTSTKQWKQLHSNLIDGERRRNAYWQACIDEGGTIHLSWVWRESPDVASNHDLCYARSTDGGLTWEESTGEKYSLPINAASAEIAVVIPQKSELINQTSMFADAAGQPFIATYWREQGSSVPQYHLVFKSGADWKVQDLGFRTKAFSLSGAGTKRIPIARPQIIAWNSGKGLAAAVIFRDEERGSKVSAAICHDLKKGTWQVQNLYDRYTGSWEPSYDTELWKQKGLLHLFVQRTEQVDAEGKAQQPPTSIEVLEWKPGTK